MAYDPPFRVGQDLSLRHEGYLADSVMHGDTAMRLSRTKEVRSNGEPRRTEGNMMRENPSGEKHRAGPGRRF